MNGWRVTTLGEFIDVKHGFAFKGEYFSEQGKYVVLTPGNFHEVGGFKLRPGKDRYYLGEIPQGYILNKGDMIVAMTEQAEGLLGSAAMIPAQDVYLHNQRLGLIKVKPLRADKRYLYYIFNTSSVRQQIRGSSSGTKIRHTSPERIRSVNIFAPGLHVQKKIAAILSAYDDLIENNQRRIALLEKMAEEIYREWFVRMRFPGHKKVKFVKGIPENWTVKKFREIVEYYIGGGWGEENQSTTFSDGAYVIRGTDIPKLNNGELSEFVFRYHKPSNLKSRKLGAGDFVFEVSGGSKDQLLGRSFLLTEKQYEFFNGSVMCASFCKQIRFKDTMVSPYFIKYFLKLYYDSDLVGLYQVQSTGISNYQFESFLSYQSIVLPSYEIRCAFEKVVKPALDLKDNLALANLSFKRARDSLLPRLISGKLSVENLDIHFPPSMRDTGHDQ